MVNVRLTSAAGTVLLCLLSAGVAWGQQFSGYEVSGTSYRVFARPGQNTIQVLVIGNGGQSGLYKVGDTTDLTQLVALAGGSGSSNTTVRLFRVQEGERRRIYEAEMGDFIKESSAHPALATGDVVQIETPEQRERFTWRDALQIVTAATSLTFAIERLTD